MDNQKLFIDETEEIISLDEIKAHFDNGMTAEEKAEYNNNFEEYLICCIMPSSGIEPETHGFSVRCSTN